jgi:6,7-dimethyl-8-ribityllumazine synthase
VILIVQSLWNEAVTDKIVEGAVRVLADSKEKYQLIKVPGALEIPLAVALAHKKWKSKLKGVIACGTVVKGDTYHFEVVANESARALTDLQTRLLLPIANAILTTFDVDQALERVGGRHGHKGEEAAHAVCAMIDLMKKIKK